MKKTIRSLILICLFASLSSASVVITNFFAQTGINMVTLKWTTQNQEQVKGFDVERSLNDKSSSYRRIDFVPAKISTANKIEYAFEDKSVFKSAARTFYYRLKIINLDGTDSYSKVISVSPTVSSVRQTWGSIKAMFR